MGRGAIAAGIVIAAAAGCCAWLLLGEGGAGSPAPGPLPDAESAREEASAAMGPGLEARARPAPAATAHGVFRIRGNVKDAAGAPVAGVRVTAKRTGAVWDPQDSTTWGYRSLDETVAKTFKEIDAPSLQEEKPEAEATGASDGSFEITVGEAGNYDVAARPEAPRVGTHGAAALTVLKPQAHVTLLALAGSRFAGRVMDASGRGAAAVVKGSVAVEKSDQSFLCKPASTDPSSGDFAFNAVPDGKLTLSVSLPGRMTLSGIETKTPFDGVFLIRIGGGGVLRGRVTNLQGEPVTSADVAASTSVSGSGGGTGEPTYAQARAKSGADGTWRMEGVPPGKVTQLTVRAAGYSLVQQSTPRAPWAGAEIRVGQDTVIDVVVKKGGSVVGRVTETGTGSPVADAEIRLTRSEMSGWYGPPPLVTTDADGRYRFDDVALGKYLLIPTSASHFCPSVEAALEGGNSISYDPSVSQARSTPASLTVVLVKEGESAERNVEMRRGLPVKGTVVGPDGASVAGARIRSASGGIANLSWQWGFPGYGGDTGVLATSKADGTFEVPGMAPRPAWVLVASKDDFLGVPSEPFKVAADAPVPSVALRLAPGGSVSGRVIDASGKGLASWNVWYWAMEAQNFQGNTRTTTDGDGAFTISGLPAGKGQVQGNGPNGGGTQYPLDPPLSAGEKRKGIEIKIEGGAEISGILVDADGKPVGGQSLSASAASGGNRFVGWAQTKADGTFTLTGVAPGKVQMNVSEMTDEGYGLTVAVGDPVEAPASGVRLVYTPKKRTTITARITDSDGKPVPLCLVTVSPRTSQRNFGGQGNPDEVVNGEMTRSVEGTPPFTLSASAPRDVRGQPLNLQPNQAKVTDASQIAVIVLSPGLELAGRVVGPDGKGVEAVTVKGGAITAMTDGDGGFRILGLATDAEMDVTVQPPSRFAPPPSIRAKPGDKDVVVRLSLGAVIAGRILGPDDKPVANASISVEWQGAARTGNAYGNVQAEGRFRVEGLGEDSTATLTVQPWSQDGSTSLRTARIPGVRAGTEDLVIRLALGVTIEGRVVYADGARAPFSYVMATRVDAPAGSQGAYGMEMPPGEGTFKIAGLEPGPFVLVAHSPNGRSMGEGTKVDAPAKNVRIVVAQPAKIMGRVEGALPGTEYWITAWPSTGTADADGAASVKLAADGTFAIDVPADKEFYIGAMYAPDDRYAMAGPVRAGASDVVLRFQPGGSIDGVLEDAGGAPKGDSWVYAKGDRWRAHSKTDAEGRFHLRGLPAGHYALTGYTGETFVPVGDADAGASSLRLRLPAK